MKYKATVLYIDDEYLNISAFEILFKNKYNIFTTTDPKEAIRIIKNQKVDVIIADQKMPVMTGVELLKQVLSIDKTILRIIHSGYVDDPEILKAADEGIVHSILDKPLDKVMMLRIIDTHIELNRSSF